MTIRTADRELLGQRLYRRSKKTLWLRLTLWRRPLRIANSPPQDIASLSPDKPHLRRRQTDVFQLRGVLADQLAANRRLRHLAPKVFLRCHSNVFARGVLVTCVWEALDIGR